MTSAIGKLPAKSIVDPDTAGACLAVHDLTAGYGGPPVIRGVSVAISKGQVAVVAGPNGAGKSTLVKSIVGHLRCSSGRVVVDGREVTNRPAEQIARGGVGYVPQNEDVFGSLTVIENLEMGGYLLRRRQVPARIDEIFGMFPALAVMRHRQVSRLSGGERKMVAMGRVLMLRPPVLVLDEPTAGLSVALTHELFEQYIPALTATDVAVLLVEQKATEALRAADWGYILVSGEVHVSQPAATILGRPDLGEVFLGGSASVTGDADEQD